jgi:hypothetical protein
MVSQTLKRKAYQFGADDIVESWRQYKILLQENLNKLINK